MQLTTFESRVKGYHTFVSLPNGSRVSVRFETVQYQTTEGPSLFHTADEKVIEALKKHPRYNDVFVLKCEPSESAVPAEESKNIKGSQEIKYQELVNPDKEIILNHSVTTAALARAFVQQQFGEPIPGDCKTNAQIKEYAARTHNLIFEAWH